MIATCVVCFREAPGAVRHMWVQGVGMTDAHECHVCAASGAVDTALRSKDALIQAVGAEQAERICAEGRQLARLERRPAAYPEHVHRALVAL